MKSKIFSFFLAASILTVVPYGKSMAQVNDAPASPVQVNPAAPAATKPAVTEPVVDPNLPKTTIEFSEMEWDFGKIKQDEKHVHVFKFTNTGVNPLTIAQCKGSCGCTVPEWPKEPIAPGGQGEIKVQFNSGKKKGKQNKTVTIQANTDPNPTVLQIKSDIEAPAEPAVTEPANKNVLQPAPAEQKNN